jgi:hypothetical protein
MDPSRIGAIPLPQIKRTCGGCTECCMAVAVAELEKPYFAKCRHQAATGCSVYAGRPKGCRQYNCAWLQGLLTDAMRPDKSGFIVSAEAGGLYIYIVRDLPIEPLLTQLAAFDFATPVHGAVGIESTPIWVYRLGQQVATAFDDNPDNQGKPLPARKTLYSARSVQLGGKWFAIGSGPWRPVLEPDQTRAGNGTGQVVPVVRLDPHSPVLVIVPES